jgi:hypothetical protein
MADGDTGSKSLDTAKALVGLFAGAATLIYATGGAILALRLLFDGIPGLSVVPVLPREFLISLGATQVVFPAIVIGALLGIVELGQTSQRLIDGHRAWGHTNDRPRLRRLYLAAYCILPLLLIAPGAAIALSRDGEIGTPAAFWIAAGCGLLCCTAVLAFVFLAVEEEPSTAGASGATSANPPKVLGFFSVGVPLLLVSCGLSSIPYWVTGDSNLLALLVAWLLSFLVVLLWVFLRGGIGKQARDHRPPATTLTILSWATTALLAVPALVAVAAAQPLEEAKVCTKSPPEDSYTATGTYIGETKERVYVGDQHGHRVISIPTDEVTRVAFGREVGTTQLCTAPKTEGVPTVTATPPAETKPTPPTPAADVTGPDLSSVLLVTRSLRPDASVLLVFSSVPESLTGVASLVTAGNRQLLIASHSFQRRNPEALRLRFRLSMAAQRLLHRERRLAVKLRLAALDDLGNTSRRCLRFTLARVSEEAPSVC